MAAEQVLRRWRETDSFAELTELLHRAYGPLAAEGLKFFATHQTEADTRQRALEGECFVVEVDGRIVATVTLRGPQRADEVCSRVALYMDPGVYTFGQFGVEPAFKGRGIGRILLDAIESRARELGATQIACDTAEPAKALIAMYERRGYRTVGTVQWDVTNYRSVVLAKPL
jgi:GNAT superfamily N-acetyltransferase